jgi:hypothetical protein
MKGAKFIGEGTEGDLAYLKVYRHDTVFFIAASKLYLFEEENIIGKNTAITFRLDTDSIYHPGLAFKYFNKTKEISLIRSDEGMGRSPFFNTYHDLEMDFQHLVWKLDDPKIDFKFLPGTTELKATFESSDYFSRQRFLELQGMDQTHPLQLIRGYCKKYGTNTFTDKEYGPFIRMSESQTKQQLMALAFTGFIAYNFETGIVVVLPKTNHYLKASVGQEDYDVISFVSSAVQGDNNATLSLLNFDLKLKGVQEIFLSDSQNVVIFPKDQEITVKENRDFVFDGRVRAGLFLFTGSNFTFEYDKFKINLNDVNTVKMRVNTGATNEYGQAVEEDVKSVIENVTGELLIDDMTNKAGTKPYPQYPIFNSKKDCYVFYDRSDIHGGVYKRDNFYFQIFPFVIDSLDELNRNSLAFKGHFVSSNIFPPFDETISVMADYSLGFKRNTPEPGFPVYGGKGNYKREIFLSNKGLRGDGELKFLNARAESNDYLFFPDSMNALAQVFEIEKQAKGVQYPATSGEGVYIHWVPQRDRMYVSNRNKPFQMYDNQATFTGTLEVSPEGLNGAGTMEFSTAQLHSSTFDFKEHIVDADTSNFNLKTLDMADFSFKTNNVRSHIDFTERKGEFTSNGDASFVEFPQNQYICYMDQFTWFMDKDEIEMSASNQALANKPKENMSPTELEDVQLQGSQFISIHPNQDSLTFVAPKAKYNLRKYIISAEDVKFIRVADATVYPGDGKVVIEKKAVMQTLNNSKIIANNTNRYHTIYGATTNVYGKKNYSSAGKYDYFDETGAKQIISFDVVSVDSSYQTYAKGKIGITENFTLSPAFAFTGEARLYANDQFLTFDGSTKISHECQLMERYYVNFTAPINPQEIFIPIGDTLKEINNNKVHAGFFITNDSTHIYPAFLTKHKNYSDIAVFRAKGFLTYDKTDGKYKISNKEKLEEFNMPGDYLSLHKTACIMYGEGKLDLGVNFGQVKVSAVGNITEDLVEQDISLDLILGIDFFILDKAMDVLTKDLTNSSGLEPVDLSRKVFEKGLAELMGEEAANELIADYSLGKFKKVPKELEHTLTFIDLKLNWNSATKSYLSDSLIGIGLSGKNYINRIVPGIIEVVKKRSGDIITIYLELDENTWYYFSYARGVMQVSSSNEEFNTLIKTLKPEQRRIDVPKGEAQYSYYPAAPTVKNKFLKKIRERTETPEEVEEGGEEGDDKKKEEGEGGE